MSNGFSIKSHKKQDDLFIDISGGFDGSSAWELANTILTSFDGGGRVIIDTRSISHVLPFGAEMISNLIPNVLIKKENVLVKDRKGIYKGIEHFHTLVEKKVSGNIKNNCLAKASIC
ncbi:MAG: hypothetical protein U9N77_11565 [Thermodesulfobacteriota bacterium]|nr:hypothetical protein [Thermodesulfobacteriota bacterium]